MDLTCKDVIDIIEKTFDINAERIAKLLDVSASAISRLKNGETKYFSKNIRENIYEKVFDTKTRLVSEDNKYLFSLLKGIMKENGFTNIVEDLSYDTRKQEKRNYKEFVAEMIKRAKNPPFYPKYKDPHDEKNREISIEDSFIDSFIYEGLYDDVGGTVDKQTDTQSSSIDFSQFFVCRLIEGSSSVVVDRFREAALDYHIVEFLQTDPIDINETAIKNSEVFLKIIDDNVDSFEEIIHEKHKNYLEEQFRLSDAKSEPELRKMQCEVSKATMEDKNYESHKNNLVEKFSYELKSYIESIPLEQAFRAYPAYDHFPIGGLIEIFKNIFDPNCKSEIDFM